MRSTDCVCVCVCVYVCVCVCVCTPSTSMGQQLRADYGSCNDHADTLTRSWTFMVLCQVLVSGPITALAAALPRRKVTISGRSTSGSYGGRKEGPRGRKGSVSPLVLGERGTMISPLISSLYVSSARSVCCLHRSPFEGWVQCVCIGKSKSWISWKVLQIMFRYLHVCNKLIILNILTCNMFM